MLENKVAYHAGKTANYKYLSIELCHYNNEDKFSEVWKRGVWLVANICKRYGWEIEAIHSHNWASKTFGETDHTDPIEYFAEHGKTFDSFINDVKILIQEGDNILEQWQKDLGTKAINKLAEKGLIKNPNDWIDKIEGNTPNWLFYHMLNLLNSKLDNLKIVSK